MRHPAVPARAACGKWGDPLCRGITWVLTRMSCDVTFVGLSQGNEVFVFISETSGQSDLDLSVICILVKGDLVGPVDAVGHVTV